MTRVRSRPRFRRQTRHRPPPSGDALSADDRALLAESVVLAIDFRNWLRDRC
jgi:hypothetical protein